MPVTRSQHRLNHGDEEEYEEVKRARRRSFSEVSGDSKTVLNGSTLKKSTSKRKLEANAGSTKSQSSDLHKSTENNDSPKKANGINGHSARKPEISTNGTARTVPKSLSSSSKNEEKISSPKQKDDIVSKHKTASLTALDDRPSQKPASTDVVPLSSVERVKRKETFRDMKSPNSPVKKNKSVENGPRLPKNSSDVIDRIDPSNGSIVLYESVEEIPTEADDSFSKKKLKGDSKKSPRQESNTKPSVPEGDIASDYRHIVDVLNEKTTDDSVDSSLNAHIPLVSDFVRRGSLQWPQHSSLIKKMFQQKCVPLLNVCADCIDILPEWFFMECISLPYRSANEKELFSSNNSIPALSNDMASLLTKCLRRPVDRYRILILLRKSSFHIVSSVVRFIVDNLLPSLDMAREMEVLTWISVLIESHLTQWTLTSDFYALVVRLNQTLSDEIQLRCSLLELQGQIKTVTSAASSKDDAMNSRKYWQSVIDY